MPRQTCAYIDLAALRHNYQLACTKAGHAQVMAVVKADGYGHGIGPVAGALSELAECFAVACIEEARAIRRQGLQHPVVLLEGVHAREDLAECVRQGFEPVLHNEVQVGWLLAAEATPPIWLKVNTGMNRLGLEPASLPGIMSRLGQKEEGRVRGFMTHFACADDPDSATTGLQTARLEEIARVYPDMLLSLANSAAHFRPGQPLHDWTRPGIMLYGATPMLGSTGPQLGLQPVMSLESELIAVRTVDAGAEVGYGAAWVADRPTLMGVVAIGYGDGYPRHAGSGTPAWVNGKRVGLIGRVSMDMLAVDLSPVPDARIGDKVELWGRNVGVDEVADCAGTIAYELLTGITPRVPRHYRG